MTAKPPRDAWRWTDAEGVQRLVHTEELRAALSSRLLPPSTLVWREGMESWAPASTVAELAPRPGERNASFLRQRMKTLPGVALPGGSEGSPGAAPIVVPSARGSEPARAVITQLPRFTPLPGSLPETPVIPRAPRLPEPTPEVPGSSAEEGPWAEDAPTRRVPRALAEERAAGPTETGPLSLPPRPSGRPPRPSVPPRPGTPSKPPPRPSKAPAAAGPSVPPPRPRPPLPPKRPSVPERGGRDGRSPDPPMLSSFALGGRPAKPTPPRPPALRAEPLPRLPTDSDPDLVEEAGAESLPEAPETRKSESARAEPLPETPEKPEPVRAEPLPEAPEKPEPRKAEPVRAEPLPETPEASGARPDGAALEGAAPESAAPEGGGVSTASSEAAPATPAEAAGAGELSSPPESPGAGGTASAENAGRGAGGNAGGSPELLPSPLGSSLRPPALTSERPPLRLSPEALRKPFVVPLSSLLGAGGVLIGMALLSFFFGRCSAAEEPSRHATRGVELAVLRSGDSVPRPPRPCYVVKNPSRWSTPVSQRIPFELASKGGALALAYAAGPGEAVGLEVSPSTGDLAEKQRVKLEEDAEIERVTPTPGGPAFLRVLPKGSPLAAVAPVSLGEPFVIGEAGAAVVAADSPDAAPKTLWKLPEAPRQTDTTRVLEVEGKGAFVALRRAGALYAGWVGEGREPLTPLERVAGSGGALGKPALGWNRRGTAIAFADHPGEGEPWQIRIGGAAGVAVPKSTRVLELPKGGPGGDAFGPSLVGLPDGRWLVLWTEGPVGASAVRAQTLGADFEPIGDPLALSPPAGNFGQGALGLVEGTGYVAAVFLQRGAEDYELWGGILQCG